MINVVPCKEEIKYKFNDLLQEMYGKKKKDKALMQAKFSALFLECSLGDIEFEIIWDKDRLRIMPKRLIDNYAILGIIV